ncbi:hypothetical protein MTR67_010889 [Solanum verrucosum]|uniref:AN1-type domain-containing protein n=1 Tax=Solanum verrucosum TaxID=315347 RepID=A0AAF0Q5T1_SOLVR|nr:hypothetical protein MTR67_010889 [Solanum verrucosum]
MQQAMNFLDRTGSLTLIDPNPIDDESAQLQQQMEGGTEAYPDLGKHCQLSDCHQLDFLPFTCHACQKSLTYTTELGGKENVVLIQTSVQVFCVEHRSCKSHECPKSDFNSRMVLVCEICSMSIETTGCQVEDHKAILRKHEESGDCDPKKKKKPTCPVKRCKGILTFSNTSTCKTCRIQVCLRHRFPADHACNRTSSSSQPLVKEANNKFLTALLARGGNDCGNKSRASSSRPANPSVKAC